MTPSPLTTAMFSLLRRVAVRLARAEDGVSVVEFAATAPILALMLVGLVDFGMVIDRKMELANAVRAGVQYAMVRKPVQEDLSQIKQAVKDAAPPDATATRSVDVALYCEQPDGSPTDCDASVVRNSYVSIVLQEDYNMLLNYPGFSNPLSLREAVTIQMN